MYYKLFANSDKKQECIQNLFIIYTKDRKWNFG